MGTDLIARPAFPRRRILGEIPSDGLADTFVPVYDGDTGEAIKRPVEGHVEFGSSATKYSIRPRADRKLDLGQSARQFEDGYFKGEVAGNRVALTCGYLSTFSASTFLKAPDGVQMSTSNGYVCTRAGGIIGGALHVRVNAHTTDGIIALRIYKNGSGVVTILSSTITAAMVGTFVKVYGTTLRSSLIAAQKVAAGDVLSIDVYFVTFVGTLEKASAYIELAHDT